MHWPSASHAVTFDEQLDVTIERQLWRAGAESCLVLCKNAPPECLHTLLEKVSQLA